MNFSLTYQYLKINFAVIVTSALFAGVIFLLNPFGGFVSFILFHVLYFIYKSKPIWENDRLKKAILLISIYKRYQDFLVAKNLEPVINMLDLRRRIIDLAESFWSLEYWESSPSSSLGRLETSLNGDSIIYLGKDLLIPKVLEQISLDDDEKILAKALYEEGVSRVDALVYFSDLETERNMQKAERMTKFNGKNAYTNLEDIMNDEHAKEREVRLNEIAKDTKKKKQEINDAVTSSFLLLTGLCPNCKTKIPRTAIKCPNCTADLYS